MLLLSAVLGMVLLVALVTPGPGNRAGRRYPWAGFGAPFAVLGGSLLTPLPIVPLLAGARPWQWALAATGPVAAYAMARRVSPPWWRPWHGWIAGRAALLLFLVAGTELTLVDRSVPATGQAALIWIVSLIVTAGYLACWRVVDTGYWPLLLIRDGAVLLAMAGAGAWWQRRSGLDGPATTLLVAAVAAVGVSALLAGMWRLVRWLRHGPPSWPRPPGPATWPPQPGQVWNATVDREDRPVVVWELKRHCAYVLAVTSSDGVREHMRLPLAEWHRVLSDDAWLSLQITAVPYTDFRSVRGRCPDRFWERMGRRTVGAPAALKAPTLRSAANLP
ncbi:hypothetical protein [Actinoplanes xinjiangensis]|uniref:Uncharacterized protein n=1 Tax=Actinoplanes xinjiangensis TaxID=512350 RepID=A0A316FEB8_9ACTN|nr:hypothetical protein [Actinoplanes xinjiangensis]PWK47228.1 hypothetical protein BC793_108343 [Actinoplanes xinjiangensis]GIF40386.1 hypothetical protein Axi01nite_46970 [Actinoplanes xinjiangensis]